MKFPFPRKRSTSELGLVDRSVPDKRGVDEHPDEWHAVQHPLFNPVEGRAEFEELVEREVARLVQSGAVDEAHAGVLDHFIEDRRRQMEQHITQTYRTRIATQAGLTRRARVNHDLASLELRDLRAEHLEALQTRAYNRDLLLGRAEGTAPRSVVHMDDDRSATPARPSVMPGPVIDTSRLHGENLG